jgi:allophanate hydrolase
MNAPVPFSIGVLRGRYEAGDLSPKEVIELVLHRIEQRGEDAVWIHRLSRKKLLEHVDRIEAWKKEGKALPLYGIPFAIKDNIDLASHPTTAACPAYAYTPVRSATAVERLVAAGAIPIGKTNLDQFATGLVGTRSPYGAPRCVFDERYISGGSSSGSAVAVAAGLVGFALGTDTAGSGRVPAAFNNIVGLKPTRGRISTVGLVPACRSLDCISIFAGNCSDARDVLKIVEGAETADAWSRVVPTTSAPDFPAHFRFGVPQAKQLEFFGDNAAAELYAAALLSLEKLGGRRVEIDFVPFRETALLLYTGPWVAERLAAMGRPFFEAHIGDMDPVVGRIVEGAKHFDAVDAFNGLYRLQELRARTQTVWQDIDVMALPTTGTIYTVEEIRQEPVALNSNLGYYTNFMNLLDLAGLALPAGFRPNGLPFGITLAAPAFSDEALIRLGTSWEGMER